MDGGVFTESLIEVLKREEHLDGLTNQSLADKMKAAMYDSQCHFFFSFCLTLVHCLGVQPFTAMVNKLTVSSSIHDWNHTICFYGAGLSPERSSSMPVTHKAFELLPSLEFMLAASRKIGTQFSDTSSLSPSMILKPT